MIETAIIKLYHDRPELLAVCGEMACSVNSFSKLGQVLAAGQSLASPLGHANQNEIVATKWSWSCQDPCTNKAELGSFTLGKSKLATLPPVFLVRTDVAKLGLGEVWQWRLAHPLTN